MFHQFFPSPQVKRSLIISNQRGIYALPHGFPNDLSLRISGNQEKTAALFQMKNRIFLKYFVRSCLWKQFFAFSSPQASSNVICLTILVTPRSLLQFQPKIQQSCQKVLKFVLHYNYFFDLFTAVQIWYSKASEFGLGRSFFFFFGLWK